MPTRTWNETTPAGTRQAKQIDDAIKELKVDIRERLDEILGGSFATDPVVDGTIIKSIATLVTEVAAKATLAGLTSGRILKATSTSTLGNSSITEDALTAAIASPTKGSGTISGEGVIFQAPEAGTILIVVRVEASSAANMVTAKLTANGVEVSQSVTRDDGDGNIQFNLTLLTAVDALDSVVFTITDGAFGTGTVSHYQYSYLK